MSIQTHGDPQVLGLVPEGARGVNLIGYASRNIGIGVAFRHIANALVARGIPISIFDLPRHHGHQGEDNSLGAHFVSRIQDLPYEINVFLLNIMALPEFLLELDADAVRWNERLNVAVIFWELPVFPQHWKPVLGAFDAILCSSWFIREAVGWQVPGTMPLHLQYPLSVPEIPAVSRAAHGVPEDAFAFYFSFDPYSGIDRKNPFAVLAAFDEAFGADERVHLVVKLNAPAHSAPSLVPQARSFLEQCELRPNVTVILQTGSYADALALCKACCDCFVSLHRAEGLGLAPIEAMLLGKPTILTGWSGNMSYTTADTSCLVPYSFVRPDGLESPQFDDLFVGARVRWADPCVSSAAYWMRRVVDDRTFREALAGRAGRRVSQYLAEAAECRFVGELEQLFALKRSGRSPGVSLQESARRIRSARARNVGLRLLSARRFLAKRVPGVWRFVRWVQRRS